MFQPQGTGGGAGGPGWFPDPALVACDASLSFLPFLDLPRAAPELCPRPCARRCKLGGGATRGRGRR